MGMKNCAKCGVNLNDYKDKPYEEWPCASCQLAKDYSRTFSTGYFDTADLDSIEDEHHYESEHEFVTQGDFPLTEEELASLETIKEAITSKVCMVFAGLLVRLLKIAKTNPIMFEVFIKKMQFPYMSYAEIGESMEPKCSKQNVLYHLKCIVDEFPELLAVIHTDTRYTAGTYALKTVADRKKMQVAVSKAREALYGKEASDYHETSIVELNKILRLPFNMREDVFNFNAYLHDENHLRDEEEEEDGSDKNR